MALPESGEMYLESVLVLSLGQKTVHAVDVCEYMRFSKPSVSRALKKLKAGGFITVDENRHIFLTQEGERVARALYERHTLLTEALTRLGVSYETAARDACLIEHDLSAESFEAIKKYMEKRNNA